MQMTNAEIKVIANRMGSETENISGASSEIIINNQHQIPTEMVNIAKTLARLAIASNDNSNNIIANMGEFSNTVKRNARRAGH